MAAKRKTKLKAVTKIRRFAGVPYYLHYIGVPYSMYPGTVTPVSRAEADSIANQLRRQGHPVRIVKYSNRNEYSVYYRK